MNTPIIFVRGGTVIDVMDAQGRNIPARIVDYDNAQNGACPVCDHEFTDPVCAECGYTPRKDNALESVIAYYQEPESPSLIRAASALLRLAEKQLDQSATHDGLTNCDALAALRAALQNEGQ